ncbi:MAG: VWA domain-containing protein [Kofleriaceae bacterium]|nr:VWA domain-containing protein [Kofleriaceae bacterium]
MRIHRPAIAALTLFACLLFTTVVHANQVDPDRTLSPYFVVRGADPDVDALPLKKTSAEVDIAGVIANVRVTQEYRNDSKTTLEAIYVFPASTRAAVHAMRMRVGNRLIEAKISDKKKARAKYEKAKKAGKTASLLEQKRPNVFQMNVANILPGDVIKVEMEYVEQMVPEDGLYTFVYPTVVGPRYSEKTATQTEEEWLEMPYSKEGKSPTYEWDLSATIRAGVKLAKVSSTSHPITSTFSSPTQARIEINDPKGGNRDFLLSYEMRSKDTQTGLLLYEGKRENYFLAMVQPPKKLPGQRIPPREYIFILDVSGSMNGRPLDTAKEVMNTLFTGLRPTDRFNVMTFSGGNAVMHNQSVPATEANIAAAISFVDNKRGGGGTQILQALKTAFAMKRNKSTSTSFVVVTDGYVSVDPEVFKLVREKLNTANLFSFGIGSSINRNVIEGMARAGMGEPFFVTSSDLAAETAKRFSRYLAAPALTNIQVSFKGFQAYDVVPKAIPDLFAERPILVFGKYKGKAKGSIEVRGSHGDGKFLQSMDVSKTQPIPANRSLEYLWARQKISELMDSYALWHGADTEKKITKLGLAHHLVTPFTSFLAIDHKVRNQGGKNHRVKQTLPLPRGVSNRAVGRPISVSRPHMPPGDPILSVLAPDDAIGVTAYFPFGLVKDMKRDESGTWKTRFLVPNYVLDGEYDVKLLIEGPNGSERRTIRYTIDSVGPKLTARFVLLSDGRVKLIIESLERLRASRVIIAGKRVDLVIDEGKMRGTAIVDLVAGQHELRFSAFDLARNESNVALEVLVP